MFAALGSWTGCFAKDTLNDFMAMGPANWNAARNAIAALLAADCPTLRDNEAVRAKAIVPQSSAIMRMPCTIGDYTDFYASLHHATNVGSMFRPDNPLLPNWKHLPVGYHGRASSIVVSGTPIAQKQMMIPAR